MYRLDGVDAEVKSYFGPVARMLLSQRDPQEALEVGGWGGVQCIGGLEACGASVRAGAARRRSLRHVRAQAGRRSPPHPCRRVQRPMLTGTSIGAIALPCRLRWRR